MALGNDRQEAKPHIFFARLKLLNPLLNLVRISCDQVEFLECTQEIQMASISWPRQPYRWRCDGGNSLGKSDLLQSPNSAPPCCRKVIIEVVAKAYDFGNVLAAVLSIKECLCCRVPNELSEGMSIIVTMVSGTKPDLNRLSSFNGSTSYL